MDNKQIANVFQEMADILDIQGADFFRINAYRKGAMIILNLPFDLRTAVGKGISEFPKIPGIGEGLKKKIIEMVNTGKCQEYEDMRNHFAPGLFELLRLRGVGPKKVKLLYGELGVSDLKTLKKAAEQKKIRELPGMGPKSEEEILKAIDEYARFELKRFLISEALHEANRIIEYLKLFKGIKRVQYAGSLRRRKETIGDIDILGTLKNPKKDAPELMKHFIAFGDTLKVLAEGETKSSIILQSGMQVDLRVVDDNIFGAALHYFTGSKEHNIRIRDLAKRKGLKVSEYGVFKGEALVTGKTEEEVFKSVGLPYIIPEIREDEGEIEYGFKYRKFPNFVEAGEIRGDLHSHSNYTDGKNTLKEMAEAFLAKGYEYFAITDHSSIMGVTKGMGNKEIRKQWREIEELNKIMKIKILKGCEVDILKDGSLDFEDEILKELDIVIISAHLYNKLPEEDQTKRLIAAIENPYAKILAHPTGRLINKRAPMEFNMEKVIDACASNKVALEINSNPSRLDLIDKYVRIAKEKGAKFVINTDSHSTSHPDFIDFGIGIARRGWLTKEDVINCWPYSKFDSYF